jgi:type II secretory pathway pseudopilin PulG
MKTCKFNLIKNRIFAMHNNQNGYTLVELMVASSISIVLLGILAGVVTSQGNIFSTQSQLNEMQANGRGATEFISRAVGNAGYNVVRGTKFQAASDNYISAVYDADNDGAIQNTEVITFTIGNTLAAPTQIFNINPFFDRNGNGTVAPTETANFTINMTQTAPPFDIFQITPNNAGNGVTRNIVARNIDNMVLSYYDNNGQPLPTGVAVDGNGVPIPPYNFAAVPAQMNQIRRVDIQLLARTKRPHPKNINFSAGNYVAGSVAAVATGGTNYNDAFNRQTFTVSQSPRNLALAPWGRMDVAANPQAINCPANASTVTATLVDSVGVPINGINVNFTPAGLGATLNPGVGVTNAQGQATSQVTYDWSAPSASITVAASSLVPDGNGIPRPIFSSSIASFQSGTGTFVDNFDGGLNLGWGELDNLADIDAVDTDFPVDGIDDAMVMAPSGAITRTVNGCAWQKYQVEFELTPNANFLPVALGGPVNDDAFVGGFLRYENQNSNYSFLVYKHNNPIDLAALPAPTGGCVGNDLQQYCLRIIYWDGVNLNVIDPGPGPGAELGIPFAPDQRYKMLAQVEDNFLRVKFWDPLALEGAVPLGLADPNPGNWDYTDGTFVNVFRREVQDNTIASGQIGLIGSGFNGANVIFDNFSVTPVF